MAVGDPATHVSTSMHQRYGPCGMVHVDITGAAGRIPNLLADVLVIELQIHFAALIGNDVTEFVCADEYREDYTFDCPLEDGSRVRSDAFSAAPRGVIGIVSLQIRQ